MGSSYDPATNPDIAATAGYEIGSWSQYFSGSIDEVALYSGAMSASEVLAHYRKGRETNYSNTILNTSGLAAYYRLGDSLKYENLVESMNPNGYWPMDDASGDFRDASGNGFAATATGTWTYQASGPTVNGLQYLAATDTTTNSTLANASEAVDDNASSSTGMTLSFWVNTTDATSGYLISQRHDGVNSESWNIYYNNTQELVFYARNDVDDGMASYTAQTSAINDGNWHHVVAWIDPSTGNADISLDGGVPEGTVGSTGTSTTWVGATAVPFTIGAGSSTGSSGTISTLAHVAYWDRMLTSGEREALYDQNIAQDLSGNGNHGQYNNTPYQRCKWCNRNLTWILL